MRLGDNQHKKEGVSIDTPSISLEQAAELLNVGRATVARVKAVEREAPELISKIESGEMTAHEAEKKARQMKREKRLSWSAFLGYRR
jgi:hypothetical protein